MDTTERLRVKLILGSTRPSRFSEKAGAWIKEQAAKRPEFDIELLDLREYQLPFYDESVSPSTIKDGNYAKDEVKRWSEKIREADAYIIVAPEYNHGIPAVLKNALDYVYYEWNRKPVAFIAYGSVAGARSVEQLREVAVELQMAPVRQAVHIPNPWELLEENGSLKKGALDPYQKSAAIMLDNLLWWGRALKAARAA
ncbi:MAG: NADPH-dependent FMN reductase [Parcubacteria group bacterium GW2011_GWA2_51_10]|nr:MAG: NADPH-dependent FMN reductase [Parcubacteria group bacterium GW2011_GWA2_51_10]